MQTKYIRSHSGLFAIFSEGTGLQHVEMAEHVEDSRNMGDAGFVDLIDGKFRVYGMSHTLGIAAKREAEDDMQGAVERGEVRIYEMGDSVIATNAHLPGDYVVVETVDDLIAKRIFLSGDF